MRIAVLKNFAYFSFLKAKRTIFVSEDSRQWISKEMGFPLTKSITIHHGIDLDFIAKQPVIDVQKAYGFERPFILSVSTVYRYKNYIRMIQAFSYINNGSPCHDLVILGKDMDPPYFQRMQETILQLGLEGRVHLMGGVSYTHVFSFYKQATLFVFPSYLETFGHPLLEAMALDVPVVAANLGVFKEIAGDAAVYFDPFDVASMTQAIDRTLHNEKKREELIAAGAVCRRTFSWAKTVEETVAVFNEAGQ